MSTSMTAETTELTEANTANEEVQQSQTPEELQWGDLTRLVVLVSLSVSKPQLQRTIDKADVTVHGPDGNTVVIDPKDRTNPVWTLLPKEWLSKFSRLESRARSILSSNGVGFAARGCTMISAVAVDRVFNDLATVRDEFEAEAERLAEAFDQIVEQRRLELGPDQFEILGRNLPTAEEVRKKFGIRWMVIPLDRADIQGWTDKLRNLVETREDLDPKLAAEILEAVEGLEQAKSLRDAATMRTVIPELERAKQEFFTQIQRTMHSIAREPQARLMSAISELQERLQNPGQTRMTSSSLNKIREAFQHLEDFSFLANQNILDRMREFRDMLEDTDLRAINAGHVSDSLVAALDNLQSMVSAPVDAAEVQDRVRKIRFED